MDDLTLTQLQAWRTDILVTRAAVVFQGQPLLTWWNVGDDGAVADFYNHPAVPTVLLWRPVVSTQELIDATVGTDYLAGTAGADVARRAWFDKVTSADVVNATLAQVRANFITAAGAGSTTLANWTAIARKNATYLETLLVTSTAGGASITPHFGLIASANDIIRLRGL